MLRRESFAQTGRSLRKVYDTALSAPPDAAMDDLMKLLLETSPHDMGAC